MWLTKNIEQQTRRQRSAEDAQITTAKGTYIDANGTKLHSSLPSLAPFGVTSVMPSGAQAVIIPVGTGSAALGIVQSASEELEPGEIMLYSAGGARLVLKNNGSIIANGKVIG